MKFVKESNNNKRSSTEKCYWDIGHLLNGIVENDESIQFIAFLDLFELNESVR